MLKEALPCYSSILPGRFILSIKSSDDYKVSYKARFAIEGHRDKFTERMVHSSSTLQPQSARLLLILASIFCFDIWTSDVFKAYLQAAEPLSRDISFSTPVPEFQLYRFQCLKLLKPLYFLCESGDLWHKTLVKHHRENLGMKLLPSDHPLFTFIQQVILKGLSGGYVDDIIRAGKKDFKKLEEQTNERFEKVANQTLLCLFTGFSLKTDQAVTIIQD